MKASALSASLIALAATPLAAGAARADACADRFVAVLTGFDKPRPVESRLVNQMKGQQPTENDFLSASPDHYLVRMTKPKGPWYLTHDGAMYQSDDDGKSWKKLRSFDKDKQKATNRENVQRQAATVRNAACGEATLDGVKHETLEADTTNTTPTAFEIHTKYWVNRADGNFVTRSETRMVTQAYEVFTVQTSKPAEGLKLPVP